MFSLTSRRFNFLVSVALSYWVIGGLHLLHFLVSYCLGRYRLPLEVSLLLQVSIHPLFPRTVLLSVGPEHLIAGSVCQFLSFLQVHFKINISYIC